MVKVRAGLAIAIPRKKNIAYRRADCNDACLKMLFSLI